MAADGDVGLTVFVERSFTSDGETWRVREVLDALGGRSLIFDRGTIVRRVREVPPDWAAFDEDALLRLSWKR